MTVQVTHLKFNSRGDFDRTGPASIRSRHEASMKWTAVIVALCLASCGGPTSPGATEAQVIADTAWSGFFGDLGQVSGSGTSEVLNLGTGRQCATVTKQGSGNIANQSSMTVRVGDQRVSTPRHEFTETRAVCGTGRLR